MSQSIVQPLRRWDPERIGPYAIIGRLGAGAMGQVFLARSAAGRLVAVKTIRLDLAEEPGFRARFAREIAAARQVSGVFTAAVVAADPDAELPWIATAYVPAPSLSKLVRRCGPLPVAGVRWLAAGCAEALESIHSVGLLHRDIKPSNVLVSPDGPRVIDFGVARAAERVQLTVTRGAAGTPAYMAPEQARDSTQASPASDVFSLGATLVFAAAGHPPYGGDTVMDVLVRLATEPPDLTGVPAELTDLIAACLARVPRDRPTDHAILQRLGPFTAAPTAPGSGHSYLPDPAMTLITDYQHATRAGRAGVSPQTSPWLPGGVDVADDMDDADPESDAGVGSATDGSQFDLSADDGTAGSGTALPGFHSLAAFRAGQPASRLARWRRRLLGGPSDVFALSRPRRTLLPLPARVAVALVLVGAGVALGMALHGSRAQAASAGDNLPAGPPSCVVPGATATVDLCVSQPYGDGNTVFVIHGSGFVPGSPVTITLVGHGNSPYRPVADLEGTFSFAFDQGHYFFPGEIPPGTYNAVATGADDRTARVSFIVNPPPRGPAPGQPPHVPASGQSPQVPASGEPSGPPPSYSS